MKLSIGETLAKFLGARSVRALALGLAAAVAATTLPAATPASAHGERSQQAFLRMRTLNWYDVKWSKRLEFAAASMYDRRRALISRSSWSLSDQRAPRASRLYLHGIFGVGAFRARLLARRPRGGGFFARQAKIRRSPRSRDAMSLVSEADDAVSKALERTSDVDKIFAV